VKGKAYRQGQSYTAAEEKYACSHPKATKIPNPSFPEDTN
jgi:hypothetical protein